MSHPNPCLRCLINKPKARIEDWRRYGDVVVGMAYTDGDNEGDPIRTSRVVELDRDTSHLQTQNSNYLLGKELPEPVLPDKY